MKNVKFAGYQHRYWLQQQKDAVQEQERMVKQLIREFELLLAANSTLQVGKALTIVANLQAGMAKQSQIVEEMKRQICEPNSTDSEGLIVSILEKLRILEEIVMKSP